MFPHSDFITTFLNSPHLVPVKLDMTVCSMPLPLPSTHHFQCKVHIRTQIFRQPIFITAPVSYITPVQFNVDTIGAQHKIHTCNSRGRGRAQARIQRMSGTPVTILMYFLPCNFDISSHSQQKCYYAGG